MGIEEEFKKYSDYHIATTIQAALLLLEDLYYHPALKNKDTFEEETNKSDRAYKTYCNFIETTDSNEVIMDFYEECWDTIKDLISETQVLEKEID